jgi:hypothetical protein
MRSLTLSVAVLALLLAACRTPDASPPPPRSSASVAGVALAATPLGETVRLTLANKSNGPVGYNLCTSAMLRRDGSDWTPLPSEIFCTMEMRTLSPGASDSFAFPVNPAIEPGDYAWRANVEIPFGGTQRNVISNPVALP